jgi:hypothetical protein
MALSTNYGWSEPDDSSLVKNGAADIRTLGNAIDASVWSVGFGQAGKNKIINGNFGIWQRGTSFSNPNSVYTADRFLIGNSTAVPTSTASQQTFTAGTAPVAGYESQFFFRFQVTSQGSSTGQQIITRIEDVRLFAGQQVTFSFWAKADANRTIGDIRIGQNFGSGGSGAVETAVTLNSTALTTGWARYTGTATVPSISGKTVGTSSYLYISVTAPFVAAYTLDTWGWQLEAGAKATPFQTATGTIQKELAACQRYLPAISGLNNSFQGMATSTTQIYAPVIFAVTPRVAPTGITVSSAGHFILINGSATAGTGVSTVAFDSAGTTSATIGATTTVGNPTIAANQPAFIRSNNASALILFTGCEL